MINLSNPLSCPSCGHRHTEYPPQGRCAACQADMRAAIQARARAMTNPPDDPLGRIVQAPGCNTLIVVLLLSFALTVGVVFVPVGTAIQGLIAAWLMFVVAFGVARYGWDALKATPAGQRSTRRLGETFMRSLVYLGAGLLVLAGVALAWIGIASLIG